MTVVASVAAVAAAARVFVFSRAFLGVLGFSQVFFNFLWSHRAFSKFLGFPAFLGTLRGAFGYLRGPFVSFGVPLGPFGDPLVCPRASFLALWVPLASLGGRLGVLLECFHVFLEAAKGPRNKTHVFLSVCVFLRHRHTVFDRCERPR